MRLAISVLTYHFLIIINAGYQDIPGKIPNFFSPIQLLSSVVCFLILAHGMSRFCSFISELTSRIVAGDMKIGGAGGLASRGHRAAEGAYDSFASTKYGSVITSAAKDTVKGTQNVTRGALKSITGISFWDKK